jgi:hypothetical protein
VDGEPVVRTRPLATPILPPPEGVIPYVDMVKKMMDARSDIGGHH